MKGLGVEADNEVLGVCEALINEIVAQIGVEVTPGILERLDTVMGLLRDYEVRGKDEAHQQAYIELVLAVQDICIYLSKEMKQAQALCSVAMELVIERGDLRLKSILTLAQGMLHCLVGEPFSGAGSSLSECIDTVHILGDRDIQLRSSIFLCPLYFFRGDMRKLLHHHNMAAFHPPLWNCRFLSEIYPLSSCGAAHLMGNFPLAFGIADSGYQRARILGLEVAEVWWGLQYCAVLMSARGKELEIEAHLRRAEKIVTPAQHTAVYAGLLQVKACYCFSRGEVSKAYECMATCFETVLRYGIPKPIFGPANTLELCVEFQRRGYPALAGFDLDRELDRALEGENKVLIGIALRARGLFAFDAGAPRPSVERFLKLSAETFYDAGCLLYQAPTEVMLEALQGAGEGDREVLSPERVFEIKKEARVEVPEPSNLARQCAEALKNMPSWGDTVDYFQDLVCLIQREFRAERVVLLRLGGGGRWRVWRDAILPRPRWGTGPWGR
ncbi:hypothetical protein [Desulfoluna spongiiphila]|uniref:Uncharacterized protein n=1 Tax=Desulfoluna spongiiphila TaxID=419481 RepID=A0A1G5GII7_9BACT|nr:hypothetical protein [Desulfoluna spongiiphila]SCY51382.1 hypothetical protein SAMN05216233_110192 [Desulfoluna spongiiphila]